MAETSARPSAPVSNTLLDAARGDLVLRVRGSSRDGQVVRLRSTKCTIGSGPHCTLRLRARGVRPLHCLILRGARSTIIRRWAPDTRINGRAFAEAPLVPGDQLSIGPIELDILEDPQEDTPATDGVNSVSGCEPPLGKLPLLEEIEKTRPSVEHSVELDARQEDLEARRREWEAQRQTEQERLAQWTEQFETRISEQDARQEDLEARHREWETERQAARDRLAQLTDHLEARTATFDARLEAFEAERRQWEQERDVIGEDATQSVEQSAALEAELAAGREAFEVERRQWETECEEARKRLAQSTDHLEARTATLGARQEAFEQERRQWEAEREANPDKVQPEAVQPEAVQPEAVQPEVVQPEVIQREVVQREVVRREIGTPGEPTRSDVEARDVDTQAAPRVSIDAADLFSLPTETAAAVDHREEAPGIEAISRSEQQAHPNDIEGDVYDEEEEDDEEESIDQYMSQLMDRVRSASGGQPGSSTAGRVYMPLPDVPMEENDGDASTSASSPWLAGPPSTPDRESAPESGEPRTYTPRGPAPEKPDAMAAMREVANISAQSAIARHGRGLLRQRSRGKLWIAAASLLTAAMLMAAWQYFGSADSLLYAGVLSLVGGAAWALQYAILAVRIVMNKQPKKPPTAPESATPPLDEPPEENRLERATEVATTPPTTS